MLIVTIILGLVGLGIVVIVHELGHFAAARAMGVEVEAFSVGWGPRIVGFKRGGTEWRFSAFPIGGYCKMKGEESFRKALEEKAPELPHESGTYYGASPWRRIVIALAGPCANIILAVFIYIIVSTIGYSYPSFPNRIVLQSEYNLGQPQLSSYPADTAGLMSGDRIVAANGVTITDFKGISDAITLSANKPIFLKIERNGNLYDKTVTPMLNKDTGGGIIGISYWADPVVGTVAAGSAALIAGIEIGDRIISIDGKEVHHELEASSLLNAAKPERTKIAVERGGSSREFVVNLSWNAQGASNLGIGFKRDTHTVRAASTIGAAVSAGLSQTWSTFNMYLKGLGSLFQGVNPLKALVGPLRITYMVGQEATEGIQNSATGGLAIPLNILAFLSIALFVMNLLPIPALDGGQILMFVIEGVRRRALRPIAIYRYQFIGATFILAIFVIATVGDLLFFAAK